MNLANVKNGGLSLFVSPKHITSHRIRLIAQAKDLEADYYEIDPANLSTEYMSFSATGQVPLLKDKDLLLYDARVISEYLDERFPHPALMPIEANFRAAIRLFCYEVEQNWYPNANALEHDKLATVKRKKLQKELRESILLLSPYFKNKKYLIGSELSLADCCVLPVLIRLKLYDIELPKAVSSVERYLEFHMEKDYFTRSLSQYEKQLFK